MSRPASCLKPMSACLVACGLASSAQAATPTVVAGDGVLCDLTRTLSGGATDARCLIAPGADPHHLQLTPRQPQRHQPIPGGADQRLWPHPHSRPTPGGLHADLCGRRGRSQQSKPDPHLWHSPINTKAMAGVVSRKLFSSYQSPPNRRWAYNAD